MRMCERKLLRELKPLLHTTHFSRPLVAGVVGLVWKSSEKKPIAVYSSFQNWHLCHLAPQLTV